jgi:hypothetical protein
MSETEVVALMALVGTLFGAVVAVVVVVLSSRQKATELIIADLRGELADTRAEVLANDRRIQALERRDRAWANYVHRLRSHIVNEKPPPPPEWPPELDR